MAAGFGKGQLLSPGGTVCGALPVHRHCGKAVRDIVKNQVVFCRRRQADIDCAHFKLALVAGNAPAQRQHRELEAKTGRENREIDLDTVLHQRNTGGHERVVLRFKHTRLTGTADDQRIVAGENFRPEFWLVEGVVNRQLPLFQAAVISETVVFLNAYARFIANLQ